MIDIKTVERIHSILIDRFCGIKGIRDEGLLKSALARPYATFDQKELYPEITDKAAALFESLIINHAFIDGNNRISYVLMRLLLIGGNLDLKASEAEKFKFVISESKGELSFSETREWILNNSNRKKES